MCIRDSKDSHLHPRSPKAANCRNSQISTPYATKNNKNVIHPKNSVPSAGAVPRVVVSSEITKLRVHQKKKTCPLLSSLIDSKHANLPSHPQYYYKNTHAHRPYFCCQVPAPTPSPPHKVVVVDILGLAHTYSSNLTIFNM